VDERGRQGPQALPQDIRSEYHALYGQMWEVKFHRPAGTPPEKAKAEFAAWSAEIEGRITTLRAKQRGEGHDLTQRDARALAGEWYRRFVGQHEGNPGEPSRWDGLRKGLRHLLECLAGDDETGEIDMQAPQAREEVHRRLADEAKAAQFLASKGEVLTRAAMTPFLDAVIHEFLTATRPLKRLAAGDYSADQHLLTLPDYRRKAKPVGRGASKTCVELFRAYVDAVKPSRSTITRWRCVFPVLDKHLDGINIDAFAADDARRWARSLVTDKRGAYTVCPCPLF
jgi:hypothetical protein